jgi:hypothetical protein
MNCELPSAHGLSIRTGLAGTALLLLLTACGHLSPSNEAHKTSAPTQEPSKQPSDSRAQLSIGYSLLYQEADGIPKLKWIFLFKKTPGEMGRVTDELMTYYEQLADTMRRLAKEYPGMRIDAPAMSQIESEERKSLGEDLAKDFAPLVGKTGVSFEREALLTFHDSLNEQRHLTRVMIAAETDPGLHKFLETTQTQLDQRYTKIGNLLNEQYFTH